MKTDIKLDADIDAGEGAMKVMPLILYTEPFNVAGNNMNYWTVIGNKIENMEVIPIVPMVGLANPVRNRHEARMERGKKVGVGRTVRSKSEIE